MVNLNVKSNYSLLSSMLRIDDIIKVALDNKSKAAFLCDNNMYGVMEFYKKCRNNSRSSTLRSCTFKCSNST